MSEYAGIKHPKNPAFNKPPETEFCQTKIDDNDKIKENKYVGIKHPLNPAFDKTPETEFRNFVY